MSGEVERVVRNLEPQTRLVETWWVETQRGGTAHSFGSSEKACRGYQRKHGGELQVTRLWETTVGQVVALVPGVAAEHFPECNDRCDGDSHYLKPDGGNTDA